VSLRNFRLADGFSGLLTDFPLTDLPLTDFPLTDVPLTDIPVRPQGPDVSRFLINFIQELRIFCYSLPTFYNN
jgi:hypothetical protein